MGKLPNNLPSISLPNGVKKTDVKTASIDALKDAGVSFSGYGLADGETIIFHTEEEMQAQTVGNDCNYIATFKAEGQKNPTFLVLVKKENGGVRWFNMNTLIREGRDAQCNRVDIDEFRTEMRALNDHGERLRALYGARLTGSGVNKLYTQKFGDDPNDPATYRKPIRGVVNDKPYDFVTIEVVYPNTNNGN